MDGSIHIDTRLLREHVSVVLEERRIAQRLYSNVEALQRISDEASRAQYRALLNKIDRLIQYFQKMADALEEISDGADALYRELSRLLGDDNDVAKSVLPNIML